MDASGVFHVIDEVSASTAYFDGTAMASKRYVYRIRARNELGLSVRSKWANANTPAMSDAAPDGERNLGNITNDRPTSRHSAINGPDDVDRYTFTLSKSRNLVFILRNLDQDADLVLLDEDGAELASSRAEGTTSENLITDLGSGTYSLEVQGQESGRNEYNIVSVVGR